MRRHLYFTTEEVDEMPSWKLRMYLEGLETEFAPRDEDHDADDPAIERTDDISAIGLSATTLA